MTSRNTSKQDSPNKPKVYAIDVDGTLTEETCWDYDSCMLATPRYDVINYVNELAKNNFIVIHTARRNHLYEATVEWLAIHGVKYHAIRMEKMPADYYIDDRSISPNELPEL
jgi:uncharacterized HAD superfamily protein